MWPLIRYGLGDAPGATVILYFNAFLADPMHNGVALGRLDAVIGDVGAAGMRVLLFIGRPDYFGAGNASQTWNPVLNATARGYLLTQVAAIVGRPSVRPPLVPFASVYWMGLACHALPKGTCAEAAVAAYNAQLQDAVHAASGGAVAFALHLDGPFWDACWPQPCSAWEFGGYTPASINGSDAVMAESWAQGSLRGGVQLLYDEGVVTNASLLLLDDTPNCDVYPVQHPCSTGSLQSDITTWSGWLDELGLHGTWGVWDALECGTARDQQNYYGDLNVTTSSSGLSAKGQLHRERALSASDTTTMLDSIS
jgi:hypothetical protein